MISAGWWLVGLILNVLDLCCPIASRDLTFATFNILGATGLAGQNPREDPLFEQIHESLLARFGDLIGARDLWRVMGYPSQVALQRAYSRGKVDLALFEIEHRRGRFALTSEVAVWLIQQRKGIENNVERNI